MLEFPTCILITLREVSWISEGTNRLAIPQFISKAHTRTHWLRDQGQRVAMQLFGRKCPHDSDDYMATGLLVAYV